MGQGHQSWYKTIKLNGGYRQANGFKDIVKQMDSKIYLKWSLSKSQCKGLVTVAQQHTGNLSVTSLEYKPIHDACVYRHIVRDLTHGCNNHTNFELKWITTLTRIYNFRFYLFDIYQGDIRSRSLCLERFWRKWSRMNQEGRYTFFHFSRQILKHVMHGYTPGLTKGETLIALGSHQGVSYICIHSTPVWDKQARDRHG